MENNKPIKRVKSLQFLSREHHHSLLLCWKIRRGFQKPVEPRRIKTYVDWFFENHISPHFELEEKYIYPILGKENRYVKKGIAEHRRLKRLFQGKDDIYKALNHIEEELEKHIRFEERVLFQEIQKVATPKQMEAIEQMHEEEKFEDNLSDIFWTK
ncbi:hemerythrin domain-containing protein [Arcticibacterium luteifluviistationis]|uniref:Cation-binding protein n=1 Tax=Arcticibacterium luteifluviistationis TaxID=1784714 RepID=A0A2Z4GCA9_9BACT|nr:hemerythrin domain-containing protein [Arcticibacterium luteifluviistationis]AWV98811.1 cation-binding protein [Arcticibacterium luteifluviistationis]